MGKERIISSSIHIFLNFGNADNYFLNGNIGNLETLYYYFYDEYCEHQQRYTQDEEPHSQKKWFATPKGLCVHLPVGFELLVP